VIRANNSRDSTSPPLLALQSKEGIVITHDNPGVASSENGVRMVDLAERTQFFRMISSSEKNRDHPHDSQSRPVIPMERRPMLSHPKRRQRRNAQP